MRWRTAVGTVLLLLGAITARPSVASGGSLVLPATKSACGRVALPTATTLNLASALSDAHVGWRVVYVVQANGEEPIDAVGVRVHGIGTKTGIDSIGVLGYDSRSKFPAGTYRVCVFSDRPTAVTIPAPGLHSRIRVLIRSVPARGSFTPISSGPTPLDHDRLTPLSTTNSSLVIVANSLHMGADSPTRLFEGMTCFVPQGKPCEGTDPLFGTRTSSGKGTGFSEDEFRYWATIDMSAGNFTAGYRFRGSESPAELRTFVFQANP